MGTMSAAEVETVYRDYLPMATAQLRAELFENAGHASAVEPDGREP
jgi:hypothetical protein